jgi:cell division protein FtsQ
VLAGNFFSLDLQRSREIFEAVPWVRKAVVRRVWPDRLAVQLEEHRAAALWQGGDGADRLVNTFGEVFEADLSDVDDDTLPVLSGPEGSSAEMLAVYDRVQTSLLRLKMNVHRLHLSSRGSWRAELDNGADIELGRGNADELLARTERFVTTLEQATGSWQAPLDYADLRHHNGYAVRLRGISVSAAALQGKAALTPAVARKTTAPAGTPAPIPAASRPAATRAP